MSAPNQEVSQVVQQLKHMDANTSDFSHVADELRDIQRQDPQHWKHNLDTINSSVKMKDLGFPEDFKIDGVTNRGDVITTSEDGKNVQTRDRSHLDVESSVPNKDQSQQWGKRTYETNPTDQSATYNVKNGDTLSSIATDILKERSGDPSKQPSGSEVYQEYQQLAKLNGIHNANQLKIGQELKIPGDTTPTTPGDLPRVAPNGNADNPALAPKGDVYNPMAVPGLESDNPNAPADPALKNRQIDSRTHEDGQTTTDYSGSLNDGTALTDGTTFKSERTVDAQGHLIESKVDYGSHIFGPNGTDLKVPDGKGGSIDVQAQSVDTKFNSASGQYETVVTDVNGAQYRETTDANGKVVGSKQTIEGLDISPL